MNKQNLAIPLSIVIAGALIAAALYFSDNNTSGRAAQGNEPRVTANIPAVTEKDWIIGNPNAKVKIVEYSDPECPFCRIFHTTMQRIMREYKDGGQVAWVYRHMPLAVLHQKAHDEAVAMQCAGILGGNEAFWKFTDALFAATPSNDGLDHGMFPQFAKTAGIDVKKFDACRAGEDAKKIVDASLSEAENLGIQGTPASFVVVNDEQVSIDGAQPYEVVKKIVEEVLKK